MLKKHNILSMIFFSLLLFVPVPSMGADADHLLAQGKAFYEKGDFEHAALSWEEAINTLDKEKNAKTYLEIVIHLTNAYQALGYHQKAVTVFHDALPIVEKNNDHAVNAMFLNSIGDLYLSLGNIAEAAHYLEKGMEHAREAENPLVLATFLNTAGNTLASEGFFDEAMGAYGECLAILDAMAGIQASEEDTEPTANSQQPTANTQQPTALPLEAQELKANVLINATRATFLNEKYEDTSAGLEYAMLEIENLPDGHAKAADLITISLLIRDIQYELALIDDAELTRSAYDALNKAKEIALNLQDPRLTSYVYGYLGQLYEDQKQYSQALPLTRSAIFYAQQKDFPEILYLWQWQMGRLFKAENKTDESIESYKDAVATLNPIRRELFSGYRSKQDTFNTSVKPVYLGLAELLLEQAENPTPSSFPLRGTEQEYRESKLKEARDVLELLKTSELQDFFQDECVTALQKKAASVDRTEPHTALLYPIIFPDKLILLLTLPDSMKQFTVAVDNGLLTETVQRFRIRLQTRPNNRFLYDAWQLYDWLIRPIEDELDSHEVDTLIVAPDGVLRLIPFSTLHDKEHFLVEKYAVGTVPAITLTDLKPFDPQKTEILLSGLSEGVQDFSPLPSVTAELRDIKTIMNGKALFQNKEHNIENLFREFKNNPYDIVHFATHGVFGGTPDESFLLTYDNKLTMDQLEQLIGIGRFRDRQVELLTLSACQTALGNERAALGLAGVAVKAGARSAIATLWFVDDEATSLAIREFYRQLKTPGISKVKALQNAQKSLISQLRYWHPAYWAPFLLIGNWL